MRKGLVLVGVVLVVFGILFFFMFAVAAGQAASDFMNCLNGFPSYPSFGFPTACTNAMNAMYFDQLMEGLAGLGTLLGVVLLVVGLVLQPERPVPASMPSYPPPIYGPPPGYVPPQGPQSPPPP